MATQSTYIAVIPLTIIADVTALVRGVRVITTAGVATVAGIAVRGEFVTGGAVEASKPGMAFSMQSPGHVPALASEAAAVDDPAYSAAAGKFSKTAGGGAILCGKWIQAASAADVLGTVQLNNPA